MAARRAKGPTSEAAAARRVMVPRYAEAVQHEAAALRCGERQAPARPHAGVERREQGALRVPRPVHGPLQAAVVRLRYDWMRRRTR